MAATAVSPAPVTGIDMTDERIKASQVNAYRIAAVIDRLTLQLRNESKFDSVEFYNLCLSLARGIDFSVANQEIPTRAQELPLLLKQHVQVCQRRNEPLMLAAIMVLMISVKTACESRWFSDRDSEELYSLANQIQSCFCSSMDFNTEPSSSQSTIATIMTRFYPRLKMGQILMFLEVKPGFGAYIKDFHISKKLKHSPDERARLFVAQTDNTEMSSCLVSPQDVSFLLNGKGVEKRTNMFVDTGPQMPTVVTHILKYGSNLLQAVGQFNGNYVIVIALMSELVTVENLVLQDYEQPAATFVDPDSDIIEGPSRISLNCPISFKRIKTPVKGHTCKHLQCFDFDNYIDINSKRPSWRCPHCNHHVCYTDIRIDQNMVKVLKDVGENVNDVIISADGSWKAIIVSDDHAEKQQEKFSVAQEDGPEEPGSATLSNTPLAVLDLTEADDDIDVIMGEAEDRKVFPKNSKAQGIAENVLSNSAEIEDSFWTGIYLSTFSSASPMSSMQNVSIHQPSSANALVSPVLADPYPPSPDREDEAFVENALVATPGTQSEIPSQSSLQLQAFQYGNSSNSYEYGWSHSTAQHVTRTPIAVQALPAQAPTTAPQRPRNSTSNLSPSGSLTASQTSAAPFSRSIESQQQFSRSHDRLHVSQAASPTLQHHVYPPDRQFSPVVLAQQNPGLQATNQFRVPYPSRLPSQFQNSSANQQRLVIRLPRGGNQSPGISSPQTPTFRVPPAVNKSGPMIPPSAQPQGHQGGLWGQHVRPDASGNSAADQDWRPSGRMRGSLSGRAYSEALNQFIIQPTQHIQATRPPPTATPIQLANQAALQAANFSSTRLPVRPPGGSGGLPLPPSQQSSDRN